MPKPPTSVRSIRLPDETWAQLAEIADMQGLTVNGLVAHLAARLGTDAPMPPAIPTPAPTVAPRAQPKPTPAPSRPFVSRLEGEWKAP